MNDPDQILTVRIPRWAWTGIVAAVEAWTGRQEGDIEIIDVAEVSE